MISIAQKDSCNTNILFQVASANKQPFPADYFNVITAFSAFHWFRDQSSIMEIKRVLRLGGYFVVINKNEIGDLKRDAVSIIRKYLTEDIYDTKSDYDPKSILHDYGFTSVTEEFFPSEETLTIAGALSYFKSISIYSYVSEDKKEDLEQKLINYLRGLNGDIRRILNTKVIKGVKS